MAHHPEYAKVRPKLITRRKKPEPPGDNNRQPSVGVRGLTGRQKQFAEEYVANGGNGAAAYRTVYKPKGQGTHCAGEALRLLENPHIYRIILSRRNIIARLEEKRFENIQATEERIVETLASLAFYDPREIVQWGPQGAHIHISTDLPFRAVVSLKEITVMHNGNVRFKFHDRRAALMDLARLRGMITDKSASFHFHEDLARMTPDEQERRVAELLEFAASIKVPGDGAVDVTPDEDDETE